MSTSGVCSSWETFARRLDFIASTERSSSLSFSSWAFREARSSRAERSAATEPCSSFWEAARA
jgi:hypothetical protein